MNSSEFLYWEQTTRDTIDLKKIYIDISGDIVTGVLLSQIIFWNLPNQEGHTKLRVKYEGELWLAKGREDWWEECRLSPKQFDRSIKLLEKKKIVKTMLKKFNGSPVKHIKLDLNVLTSMLNEYLTLQKGEMDIDQKVKSKFTKGKIQTLPKGKKQVSQKGKSLTENTTEITTDIEEEVLKEFREVKERYLNTREKDKLRELLKVYPKDLILKSIDIMVTDAEKVTLKYITTCLEDWKSKGIQTVDQVDKMRVEWQESKKKGTKKETTPKAVYKNKKESTFNNFEQRDYDFKDLEGKLTGKEESLKDADCSKCVTCQNGRCFLGKTIVNGKCENFIEKVIS